ncbi:hypothetical protein HPC62_17410 [Thermoleptolyngbya sichuanensis A183]|uniref:Uncharacterized protein n=1 Tax=Thermoleptolyngbya sichuanensis A183 TaxID=2737172 RepID=A0A6M8BH98_9CYAN|nr:MULTISPECIES: hypothetical protein [Thermoleptolyngbya]QKD83736.1 hypothetical protein HPC62_17410 [Thermoleptolyngbya sichuanensis A183]
MNPFSAGLNLQTGAIADRGKSGNHRGNHSGQSPGQSPGDRSSSSLLV